MYNQSY